MTAILGQRDNGRTLSQSNGIEIRAAAEKHSGEILKLTYEAFPFEEEKERLALSASCTTPLEAWKTIISDWKARRTPVVIAVGKKSKVLGTAVVRPHASGPGRQSDNVAVLARVTVEQGSRNLGIGKKLVNRALENARFLGFSKVIASIPGSLTEWYEKIGWTIGDPAEGLSWLEKPEPQDDLAFQQQSIPPELRGQFAPIRSEVLALPSTGTTESLI
ncbi:GNAT family N-acetyltransferase [Arthrobacter sp. ISL-28]|uniref:GNAT family N-acetyltransferase n=1 Tax=Arthrobacter sp. ISL-28 TaxID=2819108 RepID=UPI001BE59AA8|nr:GNAT family N-acetyltransferase [Arthrobacter sp. ISL-28]MBT2520910.1 GNAT family N-acetyltransferase [Arthrobacter sp. ISL-28]